MPTEVMLRPPVVIPSDRATYAQQLVRRLSESRKYMSDIMQELRRRQRVLRHRKTTSAVQSW